MEFGELRKNGTEYTEGYMNALTDAFKVAREGICKSMYKTKSKHLTMYEICDVLCSTEVRYKTECKSYGLGTGYFTE